MNKTEDSVKFCRVCAHLSDQTVDLFETAHNEMALSKMLEFCLHRPMNHTENLPCTICLSCHTNLISTYEFHKLCETSETFLMELLASNDVINETKLEHDLSLVKQETECELPNVNMIGFIELNCEAEQDIKPELISEEDYFANAHQKRQNEWFECFDCKKNFDNVNELRDHIHDCGKCNYKKTYDSNQFATKKETNRNRNQDNHENGTNNYKCDECSMEFPNHADLRSHKTNHRRNNRRLKEGTILERKHQGDVLFECFECKKVFKKCASLSVHMVQHGVKSLYCSVCSRPFISNRSLKRHMLKHNVKHFACKMCEKSYTTSYSLKIHERLHTGEVPFKCNLCPEKFHSRKTLKQHKLIHIKEKPHLCSECGKSFAKALLLKAHEIVHLPDKPFACELCPNRFRSKGILKAHMNVHSRNKSFSCDICNKSFSRKDVLNNHKKLHENVRDRPFGCEVCPMKFYTKKNLNRHMLTHTGERPHACSYCSRSFAQSNDLTKHLRSHVGPNTYQCHCSASFRLKSELQTHSFTHYIKDKQS